MVFDHDALWGLVVAMLGGLAIGIERQWSGDATGRADFAGVRTFTLMGVTAGLAGWLWTEGGQILAAILLAGMGALVVAAYTAASRRDIDGTTEVAAFVALTAGVVAGAGQLQIASAIIAITVLLLVEKSRLHALVAGFDQEEVRAGARFAVMAVVILPLLPEGPIGPLGGVRPRMLWALVLFFSGLSFVGYISRRLVGPEKGYAVAGVLGGLLSSTSVTLTFARLSRASPSSGRALAAGTLGANAMLFPRMLVATAVLAPALTRSLWPAFVVPAGIGALLLWRGLRDPEAPARSGGPVDDRNPLQFRAALQMVLLFQVVLWGVAMASRQFGAAGVYGSAAVLGLVDMDALTISMARLTATGGAPAEVTALAVTIGVLANTGVKLGMTLGIGRGRFRSLAAAGLAAMAATLAAAIVWMAGRL
jgi:uncharacterized membrane protein (DUF4010 family)